MGLLSTFVTLQSGGRGLKRGKGGGWGLEWGGGEQTQYEGKSEEEGYR